MSKVLIIAGILSLIHCGYSAAQYRSHLRLIEQDFDGFLPADIILQALFSLFVSLFGIVQLCDGFKEIRALNELQSKTCETLENRPSFYTFNHRGRLIPPVNED
ncbi:membrane magnesium transporter 1 [Tetranychus urticae]|uniref:membrane magnesium transporter 1 n=1 Tax=Tetranychus urticae TaxID=32264 RepID=UPI00077BDA86|nr:membrane magnesium transporter 1 [Tetranychus urticae]